MEQDNSDSRGDEVKEGLARESGEVWNRVMEPFDQDKEEEDQKDKDEKEEKVWQETVGNAVVEKNKAKMVKSGYNPTRREIEEHMVNHLPCRAWCRHCVKGKAKGLPHRVKKTEDKEDEDIPVISIDYMFMHDKQKEGEEKGMPILVLKDRKTKVVRARVVPQKGKQWYAIKILGGMLDSLGYKRVILKSCLLYTSPSPRD